ncbi:MAG TPA: CPBP family intramembrane glutamic endopeptidase [Polyangia bacterium]|nr:CPBP family intramembrane glutamic endopeptidase [Polyangia bacterium]
MRWGAGPLLILALLISCPARAQPRAEPVPVELVARAAAPDPAARVAAVGSLEVLATPAAFHLALIMMQRDLDPRVRAAAAVVLGASHDPDLAWALAWAAAADPDPTVRAAAAASHAAVAPFAKRPKAAAAFSVLCPGCGYFYLGNSGRGVAYLGAAGALIASGIVVLDHSPLVYDGTSVVHDSGRALPLFMAAQNLWFYGIFAAYRDARLARGDLGARYPVAREELPELLLAPFNPRVLKSPWVWAGLPAMLGAAVGASYLISRITATNASLAMRTLSDGGGVQFFGHHYGTASGVALGETYNLGVYLPVGVGEEALFRGVIQAGLSETALGLWGGWAVGSAIFGAAHTFNFIGEENGVRTAALAVPYLMLTGSYLGVVFIKSDFSLRRSVALHFWYDFLLSTVDFIADPDHQPFVARFAVPI